MSGICFFFENSDIDVWSGRDIDLDAWNYACKVADIKKAIIINKTNKKLKPFDADMDIKIVNEFSPKLLKGDVTQVVTPWEKKGATSLWNFNHKTDWYVFGPADGWRQYFGKRQLTIPQNGEGACHAVHIATVVMFHRYKTLWQ